VLEVLRPALVQHLNVIPEAQELVLPTPQGQVTLRRVGGNGQPGSPIQFSFATDTHPLNGANSADNTGYHIIHLPDADIQTLGQRLVGLDAPHADVLTRLACRDGGLDAWSTESGMIVPQAVRAYFERSCSLFLFVGDPGVGKSVSAQVLVDAYCRRAQIAGHLLTVGTEVRSDRVGEGGRRIKAAFTALRAFPDDELKALVIDESDALVPARNESQMHHEDRCSTMAMLQCLDATIGISRAIVIMTSNRLDAIDPAIVRRAVVVHFARPNAEARRALLQQWLPDIAANDLDDLVVLSDDMAPSDIERALMAAYITAIGKQAALTLDGVYEAFLQATVTGSLT
jgi:hypothetical protein